MFKSKDKYSDTPPEASIKRNTFFDDGIFGVAYDQKIVLRFGKYLKPFRKQIMYSFIAVLFFSISSVSLPLIIKFTIDSALYDVTNFDNVFLICIVTFFIGIIVNFISTEIEWISINNVIIPNEYKQDIIKFLETLEEDDDVQNVYNNIINIK